MVESDTSAQVPTPLPDDIRLRAMNGWAERIAARAGYLKRNEGDSDEVQVLLYTSATMYALLAQRVETDGTAETPQTVFARVAAARDQLKVRARGMANAGPASAQGSHHIHRVAELFDLALKDPTSDELPAQ